MLNLVITLALLGAFAAPSLPANERCPVTGVDVRNHRLYHYVTLQGRNWYVADRAAAIRLKNCPECYLPVIGAPVLGKVRENL